MIESLPDLPDGLLGYRAIGAVEASDYRDVLDPAIDETIAAHDKVNLVFVLGPDFERYSLGALWQDAKLEGRPGRAWGRIALVTDHSLISEIIHTLSFLLPADIRFYPVASLDKAITWAAKGRKSN